MREGESPFSDNFLTARDRFLAAADRLGARAASVAGSDPEMIADVARLGSPEAPGILILCSNGRGPGTLAGCAAALWALSRDSLMALPAQIGLVLVHAANPSGPVWSLEQTFSAPSNKEGHNDWETGWLASAESRYQEFTRDGVNFSDLAERPLASMAEAAFQRSPLKDVVLPMLTKARAITVLDVRTGPGAYRRHDVISCDPEGSAGRHRAEKWLQAIGPRDEADPLEYSIENCGAGLASESPKARRTHLVLELGTDSMAGILGGDGRTPDSASYPKAEDWRQEATRTIRKTLNSLYSTLRDDVKTFP